MADTQAQIGFEQLGLGAVLKRYRLIVPANQRDYAWTSREVETLLQDLALAMSQDEPQHFLGTIVTIPRGDGVLEVVDGQQRLATTALILAAMRQLALSYPGKLQKALESYLVDVDTSTLEESPKMRLNTADTVVFHELVEGGEAKSAIPGRDSHVRLLDAYAAAKKQLQLAVRQVAESERSKVLLRWMTYIEHRARAILLVVPDNVNAFKMFETLNDRGLKVSQADLVKNYIFGQSGSRLTEAQHLWSYIKGSLETLKEDDITILFLRQALIAMKGYLREAEIYESVQSSAQGAQSSITFLTELELLSNDYVAISGADNEKWNAYPDKVRRSLRVLELFDIKPMRPLLLSIARRLGPKEADSAFDGLVSLGVRLIIASSTRSGSVEQPLAKAAKAVFDGEIETSSALMTMLLPITPNDEVFRAAFEVATVSQARFARYYLRALELQAKGEKEPWLLPNEDSASINLEHVLPVKPMGHWPDFDDDGVKAYVRRLGNMALLQVTANSDLKSSSFSEKKEVLKNSPYITTKMISEEGSWTPETITARQKYLADLAISTWRTI